MCSYVLEGLGKQNDIRIVDYDKHKARGLGRVKRFLRVFFFPHKKGLWSSQIVPDTLLENISKIAPSDRVLFFGVENAKDLCILTHEIAASKQGIFLWNTVNSRYVGFFQRFTFFHLMKNTDAQLYTFDPYDAWWYGMKLVRQVYKRPAPLASCVSPHGLFFIGKDKGRSTSLSHVARLCEEAGIVPKFYILRDKSTKVEEPSLANFFQSKFLSYEKVLERVCNAECILEIIQEQQCGLSLRALEALFLEKKLITNNAYVRDSDFFNSNNILIYTPETTAEDIRAFLDKPYVSVQPSIVENYEIKTWIKQFL